MRCPDGERNAIILSTRTEHFPEPLVAAFAHEVQIQLTHGGRVGIRILHLGSVIAPAHAVEVLTCSGFQLQLEDVIPHILHGVTLASHHH